MEITRDDLNESIKSLSTLVDAKLDRVLDRVQDLKADMAATSESTRKSTELSFQSARDATLEVKANLAKEVTRIDVVHAGIQKSLDSLQRYRWQLVGALVVVGVVAEFIARVFFR